MEADSEARNLISADIARNIHVQTDATAALQPEMKYIILWF